MNSRKILIIDDSQTVSQMLQSILEEDGYEVIMATSGEQGIEMAKEEKPNLVIIDTILPGIDGCETCRMIKESFDSQALKVIVMTGNVNAVDAGRARKAGADAYCVKTSDFSILLDTVKQNIS